MPKQTIQKNFEALEVMTDNIGILQHESDPEHDYSIDDQARALIAYSRYSKQFQNPKIVETFLKFIMTSKRPDGHFNNYKDSNNDCMDIYKREKQTIDNLQDCDGRAIWALSEFSFSDYPKPLREEAKSLFFESLNITKELTYPHSLAFTVIALSKYLEKEDNKTIKKMNLELTDKLIELSKTKNWMTYCVARIPQALLLAGETTLGKKYLDDVIITCFDDQGIFNPIKNPWGDEQPVEAAVTAEALADAYKMTGKIIYNQTSKLAMGWYKGENSNNLDVLAKNGAVYDAITSEGELNTNQGAESIVTYLMARGAVENIRVN